MSHGNFPCTLGRPCEHENKISENTSRSIISFSRTKSVSNARGIIHEPPARNFHEVTRALALALQLPLEMYSRIFSHGHGSLIEATNCIGLSLSSAVRDGKAKVIDFHQPKIFSHQFMLAFSKRRRSLFSVLGWVSS